MCIIDLSGIISSCSEVKAYLHKEVCCCFRGSDRLRAIEDFSKASCCY